MLTEEGRDLARQLNAPFFETSAAYRRFVDDSFHALVRIIRKQERDKDEVRWPPPNQSPIGRNGFSVLRVRFVPDSSGLAVVGYVVGTGSV